MALPVISIVIKVLSAKFVKATLIGISRYFLKVFGKKHFDANGNELSGHRHFTHVVQNEFAAKDNLIYLILMLGNVFFSLQELILWLWIFVAKRYYLQFNSGIPTALEDPEELCQRIHHPSWREIMPVLCRWVAIASLFYRPSLSSTEFKIVKNKTKNWHELHYLKSIYLFRSDVARQFTIGDLTIDVSCNSDINVFNKLSSAQR